MPTATIPDAATLRAFLRGLDFGTGTTFRRVMQRESLSAGTHPKEIVTCHLSNGSTMKQLCKYGHAPAVHRAHGHRSGVELERLVYAHFLEPQTIPAPRRLPSHGADASFDAWLALEYLGGSVAISKLPGDSPLQPAVRVAAQLHSTTEACIPAGLRGELKTYDRDYYLGWARRAAGFMSDSCASEPEIALITRLRDHCCAWIDPLLTCPPVLIHGEYYPDNILAWGGTAFAADWESAAVASATIDVAALAEGWPQAVADRCVAHYSATRWPGGSPAWYAAAVAAATVYLQLRWLGDRRDWLTSRVVADRVRRLNAPAAELGLA